MATQLPISSPHINNSPPFVNNQFPRNFSEKFSCLYISPSPNICLAKQIKGRFKTKCLAEPTQILRTCKNCKTQFDPRLNHPRACSFHTAHFGGETKRKFESVHSGGTMNTPDSGKVVQYWHCCGSEDPFDIGCTASPHSSYDE